MVTVVGVAVGQPVVGVEVGVSDGAPVGGVGAVVGYVGE